MRDKQITITVTTEDNKALRHVASTLEDLAKKSKKGEKDAGLRLLYPALSKQIRSLQERVEGALLDLDIPLWE